MGMTVSDAVIEHAARVIARSQNPSVARAFENYREEWMRDARALAEAGLLVPTLDAATTNGGVR